MDAAYAKEPRPEREIEFIAGSPIPNDQPVGEDGKKKAAATCKGKKGGHSPMFYLKR